MTAETYVKQIIRRVKCDRKRKQDIEKQLLYEIKERVGAGENLQDILSEMGTVEEIAAGFNEGISESEQRKYRRKTVTKILVLIVIVVLVLISVAVWYLPKVNDIESSDIFVGTEVEEKLVEVITFLDADDYEGLQAISTSRMTTVLNDEYMSAAKQKLSEKFGERIAVGTIYMQEVQQMSQSFAVCQTTVIYENVTVVYTITFDEEMKLAGLYMR
ncbi:MAG: DUF3887 domain-containing protein [Lachnospiraceae bacterium]|nr:DUF3887 domain-containing protein [Lachnospiraceae bacterium]